MFCFVFFFLFLYIFLRTFLSNMSSDCFSLYILSMYFTNTHKSCSFRSSFFYYLYQIFFPTFIMTFSKSYWVRSATNSRFPILFFSLCFDFPLFILSSFFAFPNFFIPSTSFSFVLTRIHSA